MKIGFIGVGTIASCMIEGFCGAERPDAHTFYLSPRSAHRSEALAAKYANAVVCNSNQHVVDSADVVIISMLATNCLEVLRGLDFKPEQHVINVVATIPPEDILDAVGKVASCSHVIPLPAIKYRTGPIAAYPASDFLADLLKPLGTVVFAESMDNIRTMQAITGLMASFYQMLHELTIFAEGEGLGGKEAAAFTSTFFGSLCHNAIEADFHELAEEMTPGGLNELAKNILTEQGAIKAWADVMEPVMERIKRV